MNEVSAVHRRALKKPIILLIAALAALFAISPARSEAAGTGSISGTVTDEVTHTGIDEAEVCASQIGGEGDYGCTDASGDGSYTITDLSPGKYRVGFYPPYSKNYVREYYDDQNDYDKADSVTVADGATTSGIDAALAAGARISGTIRDAISEAPLQGIEACIYEQGDFEYDTCASSDVGGKYEVDGLSAGTYKVRFKLPFSSLDHTHVGQYYDGKSSLASADPIVLSTGEDQGGIDANLEEGGKISGTVTRANGGAPLQYISVCASPVHYETGSYGCGTTDASGHYTITGLGADEYTVSFSGGTDYVSEYYNDATYTGATKITVANATTVPSIDAALADAGRISGTVTDAITKNPLGNIEVCAVKAGNVFSLGSTFCTTSYTFANGAYTIFGLAPGTYHLRFTPSYGEISPGKYGYANYLTQYYDDRGAENQADDVVVTAQHTTTGADAEMHAGGKIEGTVTAADDGHPLVEAEACALPPGGSSGSPIPASGLCARSDSAGNYSITRLPTGSYKVHFYPTYGSPYLDEYFDGVATKTLATSVSATAGATTSDIDASLLRGASISGTVVDASTKAPLEDTYVCTQGLASRCAYTDSDGDYAIAGLRPGSYKLRFYPDDPSYVYEYYDDAVDLASADAIVLGSEEQKTGIDAELSKGGAISGTVRSAATTSPLEGMEACAYEAASGEYVRCAGTDSDGTYTIEGLRTGSYKVGFFVGEYSGAGRNFLAQYYNGKATKAAAEPVSVTAGSTTEDIDAAMQAGGQITGAVTDAQTGNPLPGAEACAFTETDDELEFFDCDSTDSSGKYELVGLGTGSYSVSFNVYDFGPGEAPNYLGKSYGSPVSVTVGSSTDHIDAALEHGAQIKGTVTAAAGGDPLQSVTACAVRPSGEFAGETVRCAATDAAGHYTISGLATGTYKVKFSKINYEYEGFEGGPISSEEEFVTQFYNGKTTLEAADAVSVTAGAAALIGINAGMVKPVGTPPANTAPPVLSGAPAVDQVLSCSTGSWENAPATYSYRWRRDEAQISGQSGSTYVVSSADQGHAIDCVVTAGNGVGTDSATSNALVVPIAKPANTSAPVLSGTPALGQQLSCSTGGWDNSPTGYAYAWSRGGTPIGGQSGSNYTVQAADQGLAIRCEVTATNAAGSASAASNSLTVPAAAGAPHNSTAPALTGTPAVGQGLSCSTGSWTNSPTSYAYSWLRDGTAISGQAAASYTVQAADQGHSLSCEVTATNGAGSASAASPALQVPGPKPASLVAPSLTGNPAVGLTLTCSTGGWSGSPTSYTYVWRRDGVQIPGESGNSHVVSAADQGHSLTCEVTATNSNGSTGAGSNAMQVPPEPKPPAPTDNSSSAPPVTAAAANPPPASTGAPAAPRPKPLKCRPGFKKKKVKGKTKCVKAKRRHR
jgi:5-hydroxyisourate hydrolase-like protein (transthyretin family)